MILSTSRTSQQSLEKGWTSHISTPQFFISNFNRVFHDKPSIFGGPPLFLETPHMVYIFPYRNQRCAPRFSPEQIAANALGGHARKFSADRIAADALEAIRTKLAEWKKSSCNGGTPGNPKPSFLGVITFIFHGFGVQRTLFMCFF